MNLLELPESTKLYQLITNCEVDHEIILLEAHDGAIIIECLDCPFHRVLDDIEEEHIRKQMEQKEVTL